MKNVKVEIIDVRDAKSLVIQDLIQGCLDDGYEIQTSDIKYEAGWAMGIFIFIKTTEQAYKTDEYEAKAKSFDEIVHAINISSQPRQSGRRYIDKFEFTKKAENIIEKYESGDRS